MIAAVLKATTATATYISTIATTATDATEAAAAATPYTATTATAASPPPLTWNHSESPAHPPRCDQAAKTKWRRKRACRGASSLTRQEEKVAPTPPRATGEADILLFDTKK